jgi:hypothetical protein
MGSTTVACISASWLAPLIAASPRPVPASLIGAPAAALERPTRARGSRVLALPALTRALTSKHIPLTQLRPLSQRVWSHGQYSMPRVHVGVVESLQLHSESTAMIPA